MKVTVKGTLLEKYTREVNTPAGTKEERMYLRLYQPGERNLIDVNVYVKTYSGVEIGQVVELENIKINTYKDNLYARQE